MIGSRNRGVQIRSTDEYSAATKKFVLSLLLPMHFGATAIAGTLVTQNREIKLAYPDKYTISRSARSDECYELATSKNSGSKIVGLICVYKDFGKERFNEIGFVEYASLPDEEKKYRKYPSKYVYTTPFSMYRVAKKVTQIGSVHLSRSVDCDIDESQPVYRATGTCDVALLSLRAGGAVYVNFIIRDDVKKLTLSPHSDFDFVVDNISQAEK